MRTHALTGDKAPMDQRVAFRHSLAEFIHSLVAHVDAFVLLDFSHPQTRAP